MVIMSKNIIKPSNIRSIMLTLGFLCLIITHGLLSGCNNNTETKTIKEQKNVLKESDNKSYSYSSDLFIREKLNNDELLTFKQDSNIIYTYNFKNKNLKEFTKPKNKDNFIHTIVCNSQWVVWIEDESRIVNAENKPFKWDIIAQNISTGNQIVIDSSKFTKKVSDIPAFINYTPDKLAISDKSMVVYCKTSIDDSKVKSEIDSFDLQNNKKSVISKTKNDVSQELIANCAIYKDNVVWSKYRILNETTYQKRLTQYLYSDLFIFDSNTSTTTQLTKNDFYDEPSLFENNLVAVEVPVRKPNQSTCESNVVLKVINGKEWKTVVDKDSSCYTDKQAADGSPSISFP